MLTFPVHTAFLQECLEQVDLDLQSGGVVFEVTVFDNALVNSQMVKKLGIHVNEVTNTDGTVAAEYGCLFNLHQRRVWWLRDRVHALKNIRNNLIGPWRRAMKPFYVAGVGVVDPDLFDFLLMLDTQSTTGLRVVPGLL